jgi:hypothetical protein
MAKLPNIIIDYGKKNRIKIYNSKAIIIQKTQVLIIMIDLDFCLHKLAMINHFNKKNLPTTLQS